MSPLLRLARCRRIFTGRTGNRFDPCAILGAKRRLRAAPRIERTVVLLAFGRTFGRPAPGAYENSVCHADAELQTHHAASWWYRGGATCSG